jgi:surface antigen
MITVPQDLYNQIEPYAKCPDPIWEGIVYFESGFSPTAIGDNGTSFGLFQLHLGGQADAAISWIISNYALNQLGAIQYLLNHPAVQAQFGMGAINRAWQKWGATYSPMDRSWWLNFCSDSGHPGGSPGNAITQQYVTNFMAKVVAPNLFNIQYAKTINNPGPVQSIPKSQGGSGDYFPTDQCTYYASKRYHELTGIYVPWSGNASQWASQAMSYGWVNSASPVVPSIICLQPGVQLADSNYGHVGVVESINKDGTVETSDLNWGITPEQRASITTVKFTPGTGVSFIYAIDQNNVPLGSNGNINNSLATILSYTDIAKSAINNVPGLASIAIAIDDVEQFQPFVLKDSSGNIISQIANNPVVTQVTGGASQQIASAIDLSSNGIQSLLVFMSKNLLAFVIRSILVLAGLMILYALIMNGIKSTVNNENISSLLTSLGLLA